MSGARWAPTRPAAQQRRVRGAAQGAGSWRDVTCAATLQEAAAGGAGRRQHAAAAAGGRWQAAAAGGSSSSQESRHSTAANRRLLILYCHYLAALYSSFSSFATRVQLHHVLRRFKKRSGEVQKALAYHAAVSGLLLALAQKTCAVLSNSTRGWAHVRFWEPGACVYRQDVLSTV